MKEKETKALKGFIYTIFVIVATLIFTNTYTVRISVKQKDTKHSFTETVSNAWEDFVDQFD